jgi:hypothetical protein
MPTPREISIAYKLRGGSVMAGSVVIAVLTLNSKVKTSFLWWCALLFIGGLYVFIRGVKKGKEQ